MYNVLCMYKKLKKYLPLAKLYETKGFTPWLSQIWQVHKKISGFSVGSFVKYDHTCETALPLGGGIAGKGCLTGSSSSK